MHWRIDHTIRDLQPAIKGTQKLNATGKKWYVEGRIQNFFNRLFGRTEVGSVNLAKALCSRFNKLERSIPCTFVGKSLENSQFYQNWIDTAQALIEKIQNSRKAQTIYSYLLLKRKMLSLQYRMNYSQDFSANEAASQKKQILFDLAAQWKRRQLYMTKAEFGPVNTPQNQEILNLNEKDKERLTELLHHYPHYVDLLFEEQYFMRHGSIPRNNKGLCGEAMDWLFKYNLPPNVLVEFSGTVDMLHKTYGKTRPDEREKSLNVEFNVDNLKAVKQAVMALEEGKVDISQKYNLAHFKVGNYTVTVDEMFRFTFANKNVRSGSIEWLGSALRNFDVKDFSYWDDNTKTKVRIDMKDPRWIDKVPCKELDIDQVKAMIPNQPNVEEGQNFLLIGASTENIGAEARRLSTGTHTMVGFIEWIPAKKKWSFREFGFYVKSDYPQTWWEKIVFFANTVLGGWAIGDSQFLKGRQLAWHPRKLDDTQPEPGQPPQDKTVAKFLAYLGDRIEQSRANNLPFNSQGCSCATRGRHLFINVIGLQNLDKHERKIFVVPSSWPTLPPPMGWLLSAIKIGPKIWHGFAINCFLLAFAPWRGFYTTDEKGNKVWRCMWTSPNRKKGETHHPARVVDDIEQRRLVPNSN